MRQVAQRRVIEVQLISEDKLEPASALIREQIADAEDISVAQAETTIRFSTECDEQALSALLTRLAAQGMGVAQFHEVVRDLEDAFVSVTGRNTTDATSGDRQRARAELEREGVTTADDSAADRSE